MSDPNPLTTGDPPIIVQGGGSVTIIVPPNFSEQTTDTAYQQQMGGERGKDFKDDHVHLISLQIDEQTPIPLNPNAKITITYKR
ncbi:MAG TPA: hypothetical protein VGX24_12000 [Pyrinomonadaceae bacterium]|jgi:hypothetical protein|nr:hypothetical protein [Pyrinomonadaceae bacterium]